MLVGRRVLLWLAGVESFTAQKAVARVQQVTLLLLALVVAWALAASVDVRYPALALREWRTVFLMAVALAAGLALTMQTARALPRDVNIIVGGWLVGAAVMASAALLLLSLIHISEPTRPY